MAMLAQHPPALKVGGRRLSINSKHIHHDHEAHAPTASSPPASYSFQVDDYPRPVDHSMSLQREKKRKDKKRGQHSLNFDLAGGDKKGPDSDNITIPSTNPNLDSRHSHGPKSTTGMGGRIIIKQPAGKSM
ncbi:hypothetical protein BDP27DRAFT_1321252 [Rhodocollybia butyracea]|uniref:Uncharacterized protein n=1 Tax=Rhodocollybia butyracea TaxID=206335 RepID=A0A9P5U9H0_9AGAR|nr:hypothetical protein BDP27DRAFT_1321252 [Rhodocollybia butyracea]